MQKIDGIKNIYPDVRCSPCRAAKKEKNGEKSISHRSRATRAKKVPSYLGRPRALVRLHFFLVNALRWYNAALDNRGYVRKAVLKSYVTRATLFDRMKIISDSLSSCFFPRKFPSYPYIFSTGRLIISIALGLERKRLVCNNDANQGLRGASKVNESSSRIAAPNLNIERLR